MTTMAEVKLCTKCVGCGAILEQHEDIRGHILKCEKHPVAIAVNALMAAKDAMNDIHDSLDSIVDKADALKDMVFDVDDEINTALRKLG